MAGDSDYMLGVEQSARGRAWIERPGSDRQALALSQALDVPEIFGRILATRGVALDHAEGYLDPTIKALMPDPAALQDMARAAERIAGAIADGETIGVLGDYDVDGATSSALLKRLFQALGRDCLVHIPNRLGEGYGPSRQAFEMFKAQGAGLVITVDCGIAAHDPLNAARDLGLDVIVIDHHDAGDTLPAALAVVNPNRRDDLSGLGSLAAVGVVFLTAVAVVRRLRESGFFKSGMSEPDLLELLDLVGLGTVCDMVPLTGLNRAFVRQGLKVMGTRSNPGLSALCDVAQLRRRPDPYALGFVIGPRLNAAGRLGEPDLATDLLSTADRARAGRIAGTLNRLNTERQAIEREVSDAALIQAERQLEAEPEAAAVVIAGDDWHTGVTGLVASRLVERFARPAIVIGLSNGGEGTGSARSVPGLDLGAAVRAAADKGLLVKGGGHPMAAGLTIDPAKLDQFRAFVNAHLGGAAADGPRRRVFEIDAPISARAATPAFVEMLERAGPFGAGNPEPRFVLPSHRVTFSEPVGTDHVRCTLKSGDGANLKAIAFRAAGQPVGNLLLDHADRPIHIAGSLSIDDWGGGRRAQLRIEDVALAQ